MAVGKPFDYVATVWSSGERGGINAGLSRYLAGPGGAVLTNGSEHSVVALHAGTVKNLRWSCAASTLTGVGSRLNLYVNGAVTVLSAKWDVPRRSARTTLASSTRRQATH
jgi:hypothetical protein